MLSDVERRTIEVLEAGLRSDPAFSRAVDPVVRRLRARAAPVVLGVGDEPTADAVAWAVAEAVRQRCPLHLVHAVRGAMTAEPSGLALPAPGTTGHRTGLAVLDATVAQVRALAPGVEVTAHLVPGPVGRALRHAGREARLLVLGARAPAPRPGLRPVFPRPPLPWRVTAATPCPTAVVRPRPGEDAAGAGCGVVVGIDGRPSSEEALGHAFRCAQERRTCLTAVHAWAADLPADLEASAAPVAAGEACAHRRAQAAVDRWRALYPAVPVVVEVVRQDPAGALVDGSAGAALVVVGTRGRGPVRGTLLGSVSRDVLERVTAPVAVVPPADRTSRAARR
ncbi:universal stress protein [Blastococcus sp. SYSU DS0539]